VRCERHVVLIDYKIRKRVLGSMDVALGRSQGLSACLSTAEFDRSAYADLDRLSLVGATASDVAGDMAPAPRVWV
jgi:hypothetical protein